MDLEELKYPIGKYRPQEVTEEVFDQYIDTIKTFPDKVKKLVTSLSYDEQEYVYRPGGWNIKQVVHHTADSHMNAFIRFKLTLTEENPTIRTYIESKWAQLPDGSSEDLADSLEILVGLHKRWSTLLENLSAEDRKRTLVHPEFENQLTLEWLLGLYDWHCRHHLAHIQQAIEKEGEFVE